MTPSQMADRDRRRQVTRFLVAVLVGTPVLALAVSNSTSPVAGFVPMGWFVGWVWWAGGR